MSSSHRKGTGLVLSALGGNNAPFALDAWPRGGKALALALLVACSPIVHHGVVEGQPQRIVPNPAAQCEQELLPYLKRVLPLWLQRDSTARVGQGPCEKAAVSGEHQHLIRDTEKWHHWKQDCFCFSAHPSVLLGRPHRVGLSSLWSCSAVTETSSQQESAAQLSWKWNQTTGSKTLINMLCILRIRLLVTLKLNSNVILKYIICWIYFTSGLS